MKLNVAEDINASTGRTSTANRLLALTRSALCYMDTGDDSIFNVDLTNAPKKLS